MWHPVERVAENQRLDRDELEMFAIDNHEKYHIDGGLTDRDPVPYVGTMFVDALIKDFKAWKASQDEISSEQTAAEINANTQ